MQSKKKSAGTGASIGVGVLGTLIFGGGLSMCMTLSGIGFMLGGTALGLIGAGICALAYPLFKKINKKANVSISPIIESEYDKLSDISEQAGKLR